MGGVAADLPQPGVGLPPAPGDMVGHGRAGPPRLAVEAVAGAHQQPHGIDHPAVVVELVLIGGAVAEPDGPAVGVAGPGQLAFDAAARRPWIVSSAGRRGRSRRLACSSQ